jgi:hypothetical protein
MPFPRKRFQLAGATDVELAALEHEHSGLPENMQAVNEQHFETLDTEGLRDALEVRRDAGIEHVGEEVAPGDDPECEAEDLSAHTRGELNDLAAELSVPDPEKLPNKQAVIDAIETARVHATEQLAGRAAELVAEMSGLEVLPENTEDSENTVEEDDEDDEEG